MIPEIGIETRYRKVSILKMGIMVRYQMYRYLNLVSKWDIEKYRYLKKVSIPNTSCIPIIWCSQLSTTTIMLSAIQWYTKQPTTGENCTHLNFSLGKITSYSNSETKAQCIIIKRVSRLNYCVIQRWLMYTLRHCKHSYQHELRIKKGLLRY